MLLLALAPLVFLFSLFFLIYSKMPKDGILTAIRFAALYAILAVSLYCVIITELLSNFSALSFKWIFISWIVPAIGTLIVFMRNKNAQGLFREVFSSLVALTCRNWIFPLVLFFLLVSLCVAIVYPSNNYDSMTYHMARVAHWEQNQAVSHYQTHILRQLVLAPFAEWVILHFQILAGSDILANTVQLFFFAGCLINVSLITREFQGTYRQQLLSILFTCLIPMAVIQSNTTQNDVVAGYFATAFVFFSIRTLKSPRLFHFFMTGIALGLALLTKGTAYFLALPFCGWIGIILLKNFRAPFGQLLKKALVLTVIPLTAIIINSGHFYRNIFLTGSPLGTANTMTANEGHEIKPLMLVAFKNFLNHMPVTRSFKNLLAEKTEAWGLDLNDEKYNYNTIDWMKEGFSFNEDYAQNFIHVVLIVLLGIAFLCNRKLYNSPLNYYTLYIANLCIALLLFCLLLKWQPWANRLQTGIFMLFSVFLALEVGKLKKWVQAICWIPMLAFGIGALLWSDHHPVFPARESILTKSYNSFVFSEGQLKLKKYLDSTSYRKLGIYIGPDSKDYIYYKLLSRSPKGNRILKHVLVNNASTMYVDDFQPDALISVNDTAEKLIVGGRPYYLVEVFAERLALFVAR